MSLLYLVAHHTAFQAEWHCAIWLASIETAEASCSSRATSHVIDSTRSQQQPSQNIRVQQKLSGLYCPGRTGITKQQELNQQQRLIVSEFCRSLSWGCQKCMLLRSLSLLVFSANCSLSPHFLPFLREHISLFSCSCIKIPYSQWIPSMSFKYLITGELSYLYIYRWSKVVFMLEPSYFSISFQVIFSLAFLLSFPLPKTLWRR